MGTEVTLVESAEEQAKAAAEAAVLAAELAIAQANAQTSNVIAQAAEVVSEIKDDVKTNEEKIVWLEHEMIRLKTESETMAQNHTLQLLEMREELAMLKLPASLPSIPAQSEEEATPLPQITNPENVVVVVPEAPPQNQDGQPEKKKTRLRFL